MEIKASAKYLRISPRKLRLLTKGLSGLAAKKALERLSSYPQGGTELLIKTVKQAIANATNNFKQQEDSLKIKTIEVGEGPSFKRMDKSHGARFDRGIIKKRTAHLFLTLESKEEKPESKIQTKQNKEPKVIKEARGEKASPPSSRLRRVNGTKS